MAAKSNEAEGHATEKMAPSKSVIDLQALVKYYRRRGWGASQGAGMGKAKKTLQSEKHISLSGEPPEESTNAAIKSTSSFIKRWWSREEEWRGAVTDIGHHQRAAKSTG